MEVKQLKDWRRRRALSQKELAVKSGVGQATIARIETGHGARPATVRTLATALEISIEQLLGDEEQGQQVAA